MHYTMSLYLFVFKIHLQASENTLPCSSNYSALVRFFSYRYYRIRRFPTKDIAELSTIERERVAFGPQRTEGKNRNKSKREKEIAFGLSARL